MSKSRKSGHLLDLYYHILWKWYLEEENTWELVSTIQYLKKLFSSFYKDRPDKLIATFLAINTAPPMARSIVKSIKPLKQKRGQPVIKTNKGAKKYWAAFDFYHVFEQIWITSMLNILSHIARDCMWPPVTAHNF